MPEARRRFAHTDATDESARNRLGWAGFTRYMAMGDGRRRPYDPKRGCPADAYGPAIAARPEACLHPFFHDARDPDPVGP